MGTGSDIQRAYGIHAVLADGIARVAASVGAHPYDLANLIHFESGGTFAPTARNNISGATGLIQFMPSTARRLGTTTEALARLSAIEQLPWVEKYLRSAGVSLPLNTPQKLYMAVFYPKAAAWPIDQPMPSNVRAWNPGIDTPGDYIRWVNKKAKLPPSQGVAAAPMSAGDVVATTALDARAWALRLPVWAYAALAFGVLLSLTGLAVVIRRGRT